jgi:glycine/D-amino acid oxidase-like deaminating enzyme
MMKLSSGYPYSLIKNGLLYSYPKLEKDIKTDVLILGGGISGALTAHYLMLAGIDCTLIDARTIGLGSTCTSTSLLQYEIDTPLHKLIQMIGVKGAVRSYKLGETAVMKLWSLARKLGIPENDKRPSLYYAAYRQHVEFIQSEFAARKKYGFRVRYLDERSVRNEFGFDSPAAILSEVAAVTDSYLFTHHLLQYNMAKGLTVYDRTEAASIKHNKNNVKLRAKDNWSIVAGKIVYATGYEVINFISKPIVKLATTYATASESFSTPQRFGKDDAVLWNTATPYLYMRTTKDNRIIVGGRDEDFFSHIKRDRLLPRKTKQLQKDFTKMFPSISFEPEFSWAGVFGSTKDGLPYIGSYKKLPNSFFALGFGGNGITFSQVAGEIISALIKGKKNKDVDLFSFDR